MGQPWQLFHRAIILVSALILSGPLPAQRLDPAQWTISVEPAQARPGDKVLARLHVELEGNWHLYSLTTPPGGPIPTTIELEANPAIASYQLYQPAPITAFDPNFQIETETFGKAVDFLLEIQLAATAPPGPTDVVARVRYQLCDEKQCLPPRRKTVQGRLLIDPAAPAANFTIPAGYRPAGSTGGPQASTVPTPAEAAPSARPRQASTGPAGGGLIAFLLIAFGFGLAAIFTPCVFPMIPITVSFFLQQKSAHRTQAVGQATLFGLGIIVLFSGLGLLTTAILGPFGMVQLGSNPWVNGFIALVFFVFGLSLLGAFELTLPSGILTRLHQASERGGSAGTLLMGLTFSLTAFACVGPFVGTLLAASIQGGGLRPLLGMVAFATGLALPFFFLALFPSLLERMPRSGGWLPRVKVVLGFVILAASLKYLSNVDQVLQWGWLTRERFLAIWVVLFSLAGLYLLGLIRLPGVEPNEPVGFLRLLVATAFLAFAISLVPGMFGGRLGELDAYVPPPQAGWASLTASASTAELQWRKNDYDGALAAAQQQGKFVLVAFTGYACTNCHWMKANMFTRPEVSRELEKFVLVELYTDGTDAASQQNQQLQERLFSTVAIPFYAILDAQGKPLATFAGLTRDPQEFLAFLRTPENRKPASTS